MYLLTYVQDTSIQVDIQDCIDYLNSALEVLPKDIELLTNLGSALFSSGKAQQALDKYNKVLEIKPSYEPALCGKANALDQIGKNDEAKIYLDKLSKVDSKFSCENKQGGIDKVESLSESFKEDKNMIREAQNILKLTSSESAI
jgi:tetratricopeptide (TPR) repeat protein